MSKKKLVIVESPTKARTIKKFLGSGYEVESCMGHLRDLPESSKDIPEKYKKHKWSRLGVNVEDGFKPIYCIPSSKTKVVNTLKKKSKEAEEIILATDEDREGESISWHLYELLKSSKTKFKRMVFHEITKEAIKESLKNFRDIDKNLVYAQEARRVLDRLVGYTLSPVLWKNVARGLSAGRVQSVAVKLLSERELLRMKFKKSKYSSIEADFNKGKNLFTANLVSYKNKNIAVSADFDRDTGEFKKKDKLLLDSKKSKELVKELKSLSYKVSDIKNQTHTKKPQPPFTTSTLQQEANRKLSLSTKETMNLAQKLYERGFITYMRTDAVFLSQQAIQSSRKSIQGLYGKDYLPEKPRLYKSKSKGAQEAHEAIRPAGNPFVHPKDTGLTGYLLKLYQLVWQRTLASQAVDCQQKRVSAKLSAEGNSAIFSVSGTQILFDGFYRIYKTEDSDIKDNPLPSLKVSEKVSCKSMKETDHETRPPARYTEATLVQTLEKEGIGRPSTYASIISTIQKRDYVFKDKNALIPTMTGIIVTKFLNNNFPNYVSRRFTSDMEQVLDDIAIGKKDYEKFLKSFYLGADGLQKQIEGHQPNPKSRSITLHELPDFVFSAGPYGSYVTYIKGKKEMNTSLPMNSHPSDFNKEFLMSLIEKKEKGNDSLGNDPETKQPIYVLEGKYGPYVQRGDAEGKKKSDIKRVSIPQGMEVEEVDLEMALKLLKLPETIGAHPESSKDIKKGIGRFGPYIVHDGDFRSIRSLDDFLNITLEQALKIFSEPKKTRAKKVLKEIGVHPETEKPVQVLDGKYGPYIQSGSQRVSVPKEVSIATIDLDQAIKLLGQKIKKSKINVSMLSKKKGKKTSHAR